MSSETQYRDASAGLNAKYAAEKAARIRSDGHGQYQELRTTSSARLASIGTDPWVDHAALDAAAPNIKQHDDFQVVIVGAGLGGLMSAIRLVEKGMAADKIRLIDVAGGFGGAWYWNRYPGVMCDIESSMYLPFLERMKYKPKHRFAYGCEIREYIELLAKEHDLFDKAVFRTTVTKLAWNDDNRRWISSLTQQRGSGEPARSLTVSSQFVFVAAGFFNHPKVPAIGDLASFAGDMMHTARWDYAATGGSPTEAARLTRLRGKTVGVVGTGASAVQCVPALARSARALGRCRRGSGRW
ncbi:hypothetical protein NLG97_g8074 [Lecanicillium saksenae]|uniref:Uncharacterized protein n=1 Tax=Lecanicillium saksenae TaxID=468837 RepID=A0ACC1QMC6_9HYPO|nr:hypothetical protein NLG97_g8074 [Lecanicillium saksenae]